MSNLVVTLIHYMARHHRRTFPLLEKIFAEGFRFEADCPGGTVDLGDYLDEMHDDPQGHAERLLGYAADCGGGLTLFLEDAPLARLLYDDGWFARVVLLFFDDPKFDLMGMREKLADVIDPEDLENFLELAIGFLGALGDAPFAYDLEMSAGPFVAARFDDRRLDLRLVDLPAWFRMMFFLLRRTDPTQFVRSPMDAMKLLETAQDTIRFSAECYDENDLTLVFRVNGDRLFRCGRGIRPTLGSRFGPTALHLDVLAGVLKAAKPGRDQ